MSRIFLNYRRHWASGHAGRLYDRLAQHFGDANVFMDIEMPLGIDFVAYINDMVQQCDVLLALIDRDWLGMADTSGGRRLDNPSDFVRLEIAAALSRNIPVIPIYVQDTVPPQETELPDNIQGLARRQGLRLSDLEFHANVDRLIRALEAMLPREEAEAGPATEPPAEPETITNSIGMTLVRIPAGSFMMGSPDWDTDAYDDEKPQHQVTISQAFYLGIHPVTQAQWQEVMGNNPSHFQGNSQHPVENVSSDDAQQFLERLSELDRRRYTLPREAQWEYACRAGSSGRYCFGDDISQLGNYAWYEDNADGTTHPVGQKQANTWGLYDMHGNVWEWCEAWLGNYQATAVTDPSGPSAGASRVIRGGSWVNSARNARSAYCDRSPPGFRVDFLGFRCLRSEVS